MNPEQTKGYYDTQSGAAKPLSPAEYLASLNKPVPEPEPTPTPNTTTGPSIFSAKGPMQFSELMQTAVDRMNNNQKMGQERQLLIKHLYDKPLSSEEMAKLSPDTRNAISSGDKSNMEMQLRVINDSIAGRQNTLSQSVQFLTSGYTKAVDDIQKQQVQSQKIIEDALTRSGSGAFKDFPTDTKRALEASAGYPTGYLDHIQPTISEQRYLGVQPGGVGGYDLSTWAKDPNYQSNVSVISQGIGPIGNSVDAQNYVSTFDASSPITGDMIMGAAATYGVDANILMAQMQQESMFGTSPVARQNNNVAGITWSQAYQDSHPGTTKGSARPAAEGGNYVKFATLQDGINAQAELLSKNKIQVDPTIQSYVEGLRSGALTSMSSVPARYKDEVMRQMTKQGVQVPLGERRYTMAANAIVKNYVELPAYSLMAGALPYLEKIDAAMTTPGSVSDQDLLDSYTKLSNSGGVISDAQVKIVTDGRSWSDFGNVMQKKLAEGGVLSDVQRAQIQKIAKKTVDNYKKGYQPVYDQATKQLRDAQIPEYLWTIPNLNKLASLSGAGASSDTTTVTPTNPQTAQDFSAMSTQELKAYIAAHQ